LIEVVAPLASRTSSPCRGRWSRRPIVGLASAKSPPLRRHADSPRPNSETASSNVSVWVPAPSQAAQRIIQLKIGR
jgi:hypothetical protein